MMYASDSQTIRTRFAALWPTAANPVVVHTYSDVKFDPPEGAPWVRLTILTGEPRQVEMGTTRRVRRTGLAVVDIFVPAGSGDGLAKELGDAVAGIFQLRTVNGVLFRATALDRVGPDGPWLQYSASTPYQADSFV